MKKKQVAKKNTKIKKDTNLKSAKIKNIKSRKKYLVIGNWKNNPDTLKEARSNFRIIKAKKIDSKRIETVICPPLVHLSDLANSYKGKIFKLGAQNFYIDGSGPHTGEVTLNQLEDLKVKYLIIGHAERRELGESNELISAKIKNALERKFVPILCIGETERDSKGNYLSYLEEQIVKSLEQISKEEIKKIVIAYEPVWAIGSNKAVTPEEIHVMNIFIKKILSSIYNRKLAFGVKILYGGSVDPDNCHEILEKGDADGLLIGRASSNPYTFVDILKKVS